MAKRTPRKLIGEASDAIRELMQQNLAIIGDEMVSQVMAKSRNLTNSQQLNAIKNIQWKGIAAYKADLLEALAMVAAEALDDARKEVPAAKNVKFSEFDGLPASIRKKLKSKATLLVDTQLGDLEKAVAFQFGTSVESTDSDNTIEMDLKDSVVEFIDGTSVMAGATLTAAQVVNQVRTEWFQQTEVLDEIEAMQFVNGAPVTEICKALEATVFSKDDPNWMRYQPPLHWNCKSAMVPILKGNLGNREIEKLTLKPELEAKMLSEGGKCTCGCG